ncbi:hypothetical protein TTHERM_000630338 (macronuclear) [Tetrahymena thermophila SB210]|uniref:Uncharacterized protein n=1 Tax=Tetrahymena thermophila (strain SB210) TaxID=312017 RepID=W7XEZ9_TETTS|nr:hypothetical protein TTHERM_000630338 [Tetrahymena thermophila SB210]EWS72566.1 hypothetical protein TTHERM_000630338 [Tetrahymena thermophila SB210]|eukprot:XP_012654849.1 hypothetical protein TTHERM_000630338 [Tetrahymena thermophila SB210]
MQVYFHFEQNFQEYKFQIQEYFNLNQKREICLIINVIKTSNMLIQIEFQNENLLGKLNHYAFQVKFGINAIQDRLQVVFRQFNLKTKMQFYDHKLIQKCLLCVNLLHF